MHRFAAEPCRDKFFWRNWKAGRQPRWETCCHARLTSSIADVHQSIADGWQAKHNAQGAQPRSHEFVFGLSVLCITRAAGILLPADTVVFVVEAIACRLLEASRP